MSERQENFITWLFQIGSFYLMFPLGTNILHWLNGNNFPNINMMILSTISAICGMFLLYIVYKRVKE